MTQHFATIALFLIFPMLVCAEDKAPLPAAAADLKLPGVTVHREKKEIRVDAEVCLAAGLLEYAVCKPGTFEHEALLTTTAKPELIHAALLLCGMTPSPQVQATPDLWWKDAIKNDDSRLQIHIEWEEASEKKRASLESLMQTRQREDPTAAEAKKNEPQAAKDAWIFCGSFIHSLEEGAKKLYAANISGVVVGIWPDPSAVIQYGLPNGNPYDGAEMGLKINEKKTPKLGTKVQMVFSCNTPSKATPTPETQKK